MKKGITVLLTTLLTSAFAQENAYKPEYATVLDASKGERLLQQCSRGTPENISGYWTPTKKDIERLEKNLLKIKKIRAKGCCIVNAAIQTLDNFGFQYAGVTIKRKRYIYLNAFYVDNDSDFSTFYRNWNTDPIVACDGGDHFWGALFDVDRLRFSDLAINGM